MGWRASCGSTVMSDIVTAAETWASVVVTATTFALTSMVSETWPTSSATSCATSADTANSTSATTLLRKPAASTLIEYEPGGSAGNIYSPLALVVVSLVALVCVLTTTTFAPGTFAPLASCTVPCKRAVCVWPKQETAIHAAIRSSTSLPKHTLPICTFLKHRFTKSSQQLSPETRGINAPRSLRPERLEVELNQRGQANHYRDPKMNSV